MSAVETETVAKKRLMLETAENPRRTDSPRPQSYRPWDWVRLTRKPDVPQINLANLACAVRGATTTDARAGVSAAAATDARRGRDRVPTAPPAAPAGLHLHVRTDDERAGHTSRYGQAMTRGRRIPRSAILQRQDSVGVADGAEPVGDDQAGTSLHQSIQCLLDQDFAFGVEGTGRFVEDQDTRVLQNGPGDR